MRSTILLFAVILTLAMAPRALHAEGTNEMGDNQVLSAGTELFLDILNAATDLIFWSGTGSLTVYAPDGSLEGVISTGGMLVPGSGNGTYRLALAVDQTGPWDVTVGMASSGRLHSYEWLLDGGGFAADTALDGSFYAYLPEVDGSAGSDAVIETRFGGYAGYSLQLLANAEGFTFEEPPSSASGLFSSPAPGPLVAAGYALYLNPPARAAYSHLSPAISGDSVVPTTVVPEMVPAVFSYESNVAGHALLLVDLDDDGLFSMAEEIVAMDPVSPGSNQFDWYGLDAGGDPLAIGTYDALLKVVVGLHCLPSLDVETSYLGLRQYEVDVSGSRTPLTMHWNDLAVSAGSVQMPNGLYANGTSGPYGVNPGSYGEMAYPDGNSRGWGNFTGASRGNGTMLNTFTYLEEDAASPVAITVIDDPSDVPGTVPLRTSLLGNHPNPFNPATTIAYELAAELRVDLWIFDVSGRVVRRLESGALRPQGRNEARWDGRDESGRAVSAGVYFCWLETGVHRETMPMLLVK